MSKTHPGRLGLSWIAVWLPLVATVGVMAARGSESAAETPGKVNRYIGAKACKNCHSAEDKGNQYEIWTQSRHSQAFATLATEKAMEYAKARGIDDPQKADECLKCHVTAFGEDKKTFKRSFDAEAGVQCESCHGPAENHFKARFAAAASGESPEYMRVEPDEIVISPPKETCLKCHNEESPAYKPFCFHEFRAKLRHLNPLKPRSAAEKAALDECDCDAECVCRKEGRCTGEGSQPPAREGDE